MFEIAEAPAVAPADVVASVVLDGLAQVPKSLPPWLFYDDRGSRLFERITEVPEYYLTRTERGLLEKHSEEIIEHIISAVTVVELGAGTAAKTGIVLGAAAANQEGVLYQPIDISGSALEEAARLEAMVPGLSVRPQVANYVTEGVRIEREPDRSVLALYIGSSIGNFSPGEAHGILANLRTQLRPGDHLLLGTDLAPGPNKSVAALCAAYDDAAGVTAAFNRNMLVRLNRELGANFIPGCFHHRARWNAAESRMEMHLEARRAQSATVAGQTFAFAEGETIHTENSYKFTPERIATLLRPAGFEPAASFEDGDHLYAVTLAEAV